MREGYLLLEVNDTGVGIKPEFLPFVFDRFRQADSSTTRKAGGLGLGLSIVKHLVELHGGGARVASAGVGKGATFVVSLPLAGIQASAEMRRQDEARAPRAPLNLPEAERAALAGKRLLVVDDEPDARELVKKVLEDCRAEVKVAASSDEALDYLRRERFDVLVSDIAMPEEDGLSLMRRIRALPRERGGRKRVPFLGLVEPGRAPPPGSRAAKCRGRTIPSRCRAGCSARRPAAPRRSARSPCRPRARGDPDRHGRR